MSGSTLCAVASIRCGALVISSTATCRRCEADMLFLGVARQHCDQWRGRYKSAHLRLVKKGVADELDEVVAIESRRRS
jgi:hypothetical protein